VKLAADKNPPRKLPELKEIREDRKPELINDLTFQLKTANEYVGDLLQVASHLATKGDNRLHDRDRYYEDLAKKKAANAEIGGRHEKSATIVEKPRKTNKSKVMES
jgi:hypothetical protein